VKEIETKRVYEEPAPDDGFRVLVDRVWPRGLKKEQVAADLWLKEVAPSNDLRKWFGHDPSRWEGFKDRYFSELDELEEPVGKLLEQARKGRVTLLYSARDTEHNQAVALKEFLLARSRKRAR
jgi:uncharacterized protein YeaO (DUF488 family)